MIFNNITGITKGNTCTAVEQVKRFCCYQGIMCEFANENGYCQITGCVKLHELYGNYKGGDAE